MNTTTEHNGVIISEDVLSSIVEIAINEVEGAQTIEPTFADKITKHSFIHIHQNDENNIAVDASIAVKFDDKMLEIVSKVQENIASNIEIMTSFNVTNVNICVANLL